MRVPIRVILAMPASASTLPRSDSEACQPVFNNVPVMERQLWSMVQLLRTPALFTRLILRRKKNAWMRGICVAGSGSGVEGGGAL